MNLRSLLSEGREAPDLASYLDGLDARRRLAETTALTGRDQAALFDRVAGALPRGLEDIVPGNVPSLEEVVHHGRNSLPAFTAFAKVFCRPPARAGTAARLWGHNRTSALVMTTVGPGYFVARPAEREGEVLIDYLEVPPEQPPGWPPILRNEQRLSRFVYGGTQDILRAVSRDVSIGRAYRRGRTLDNWFVLCRDHA